jgi:hypothetical protein
MPGECGHQVGCTGVAPLLVLIGVALSVLLLGLTAYVLGYFFRKGWDRAGDESAQGR